MAGNGTHGDGRFCSVSSSTGQTCEKGGSVNAQNPALSTTNPYEVSPAASSTSQPKLHITHKNNVPYDHNGSSCPIDPALTTCHGGKTDELTEIHILCEPRQSVYSLEKFSDQLYDCELDAAPSGPSLATLTEEERCQANTETSGQHSSGDEWSGNEAANSRCGSTIRSDNASPPVLAGQIPHRDERAEEPEEAVQPPCKRRKVEAPTRPLLSPPASISTEHDTEDVSEVAEFEEWALENVLLKRIMVGGVATFQLQFDWKLCSAHCDIKPENPPKRTPRGANHPASQTKQRRDNGMQRKFSSVEDDLIIRLKEEFRLTWAEIHQRHIQRYPGRSKGSLQVRYCTRLKGRKQS